MSERVRMKNEVAFTLCLLLYSTCCTMLQTEKQVNLGNTGKQHEAILWYCELTLVLSAKKGEGQRCIAYTLLTMVGRKACAIVNQTHNLIHY